MGVGVLAPCPLPFFSVLSSPSFFYSFFRFMYFHSLSVLGQTREEKHRPKDPASMRPSRELPSLWASSSPSPVLTEVGHGWHTRGIDLIGLWPTRSYVVPTIRPLPPDDNLGAALLLSFKFAKFCIDRGGMWHARVKTDSTSSVGPLFCFSSVFVGLLLCLCCPLHFVTS